MGSCQTSVDSIPWGYCVHDLRQPVDSDVTHFSLLGAFRASYGGGTSFILDPRFGISPDSSQRRKSASVHAHSSAHCGEHGRQCRLASAGVVTAAAPPAAYGRKFSDFSPRGSTEVDPLPAPTRRMTPPSVLPLVGVLGGAKGVAAGRRRPSPVEEGSLAGFISDTGYSSDQEVRMAPELAGAALVNPAVAPAPAPAPVLSTPYIERKNIVSQGEFTDVLMHT